MENSRFKFRAWAKYGEMLPNVQNHIGNNKWAFGNILRSDDFKVMQYTGLKDKAGKEIYESDIISDHVGIGDVEYVERHAAFRVNYRNGRAKWFMDYFLNGEKDSIEVIGNIYENHELMSSQS